MNRQIGGLGSGFNSYAAGAKVYGGGRSSPHIGTMLNPAGYRERDLKSKSRRNAILRRMKAQQSGKYMSSDNLGYGRGA